VVGVSATVGWGVVVAAIFLVAEPALFLLWRCRLFNIHSALGLFLMLAVLAVEVWVPLHLIGLLYSIWRQRTVDRGLWLSWLCVVGLVALYFGLSWLGSGKAPDGSCF
jgi:hypothetical protein